jgi:CRISPR type III-B/RAMP module RAMP protein Cmr1
MSDLAKEWHLKALTDLWTGSVRLEQRNNQLQERIVPDRLVLPGLLGSLRWWFEVLVRGLGAAACDPSEVNTRCPDQQGRRCTVCELFGCTGWGRKFRFEVRDGNGTVMSDQITKNTEFVLRFTPLRPIRPEEWALLDLTIRLIADYGAIGGKTVYKPSAEPALADASLSDFDDNLIVQRQVPRSPLRRNDKIIQIDHQDIKIKADLEAALTADPAGHPVIVQIRRNSNQQTVEAWAGKRHHQDYGLIQVEQHPEVAALPAEALRDYVRGQRWRKVDDNDFAWASLENFWCVNGRYLARQNASKSTFNKVIGRREPKNQGQQLANNDGVDRWLAGRQQESKKVFSFKEPRRTFGFQRPGAVSFDVIKGRLRTAWPDFKDDEFVTQDVILGRLMTDAGVTA